MAGKIPREFVLDLIQRVDIVDLIDARIPLKKSGSNHTACCPFHGEKTPSFSVNRAKQFYHCFGCGAHGNAITFLIEYDRLSFPEAVESLARDIGLEVPYERTSGESGGAEEGNLSKLYELQEQVAKFYARQFRQHTDGETAVAYLKSRGVSGEIAKAYMLGYAPPDWRNLPDSWPSDDLETCGLIIRKDSSHYDRFRNRIMFPIRDRRGRVIAFGGRVMGNDTPKYLNSPETPTFKKHKEVYGLFELLSSVRKPDRILIVEGYMDVIALAQHGIAYAVATLGTATSADHVSLLFRYANELVFSFDGDSAGQAAAWKALVVAMPALRQGKQARFLQLPPKQDPDTLVREEGKDAFEERIAGSDLCSEFFFRRLTESRDLKRIEDRAALQSEARILLQSIPDGSFREMMLEKLRELTGSGAIPVRNSTKISSRNHGTSVRESQPSALKTLIGLLINHPSLIELLDGKTRDQLLEIRAIKPILQQLIPVIEKHKAITTGGILEHFRETEMGSRLNSLNGWVSSVTEADAGKVFSDTIERVKDLLRDQRIESLLKLAKLGPLDADQREELSQLLRQKTFPHSPG